MSATVLAFPGSFRDTLAAYYRSRPDLFTSPEAADDLADRAVAQLQETMGDFARLLVLGDPANPSSPEQAAVFRHMARLVAFKINGVVAGWIPDRPVRGAQS